MTKLMTTRNAATYVTAFCLVPVLAPAQSPPPTAAVAPGAQYVTIGDKPAILYDAPSNKANRNFILGRFQPLEMLVKLDKWTKVRDTENTIGWVESTSIGDRRHVLVSVSIADIRATPQAAAALAFEAQRGVLLEMAGAAADGWLPVRHRDGQGGFIRSNQVWGGSP